MTCGSRDFNLCAALLLAAPGTHRCGRHVMSGAPPTRAPPAKPPPIPPRPSHLASPAKPPLDLSLVRPERHTALLTSPPEHCAQCGVVYALGAAAAAALKAGEAAIVDNMERVAAFQVAAGDAHGAILASGRRAGLYLWRADSGARPTLETNYFGTTRLRHVACGGALTAVVTEDGQLWAWALEGSGSDARVPQWPPFRIATRARIRTVAVGEGHVLALHAEGSALTGWGMNDFGQLGAGPTSNLFYNTPILIEGLGAVRCVAAGRRHSAVVTASGHLYTFGSNGVGQCGVPLTSDVVRTPFLHQSLSGGTAAAARVACGHFHTLLLSSASDSVLATGLNKHGQLGIGSTDNAAVFLPVEACAGLCQLVDIAAGEAHSAAITATGSLFAWGKGGKGQVGLAGIKKDVLAPKPVLLPAMGARCLGLASLTCSGASTFVLTTESHLTAENFEIFERPPPIQAPAAPLAVLVATWNVNNTNPSNQDLRWLNELVQAKAPDLVVVSLQEVDLKAGALLTDGAHQLHRSGKGALAALKRGWREDKSLVEAAAAAKHGWGQGAKLRSGSWEMIQTDKGSLWRQALLAAVGPGYVEVVVRQMVGVMLCIYTRPSAKPHVEYVFSCSRGVGVGGQGGNKGAVGASLRLLDRPVCFLAAHLAAHEGKQEYIEERNSQFHEICAQLFPLDSCTCPHVLGHDHVLVAGDLNYRLAERREVVEVQARYHQHAKMMAADELTDVRAARQAFDGFQEQPVTFNPTFKFDVGTDVYDTSKKRRTPAYCDRILWRNGAAWVGGGDGADGFRGLEYQAVEACRVSDHRPVYGLFRFHVSGDGVKDGALERAAPSVPPPLPPKPAVVSSGVQGGGGGGGGQGRQGGEVDLLGSLFETAPPSSSHKNPAVSGGKEETLDLLADIFGGSSAPVASAPVASLAGGGTGGDVLDVFGGGAVSEGEGGGWVKFGDNSFDGSSAWGFEGAGGGGGCIGVGTVGTGLMNLQEDPFAELTSQLNLNAPQAASADDWFNPSALGLPAPSPSMTSSGAGGEARFDPFLELLNQPAPVQEGSFAANSAFGGGSVTAAVDDPFAGGTAWHAVESNAASSAVQLPAPSASHAVPPPPSLPAGWEAAWSAEHREYYFYREDTDEVTWDLPQA